MSEVTVAADTTARRRRSNGPAGPVQPAAVSMEAKPRRFLLEQVKGKPTPAVLMIDGEPLPVICYPRPISIQERRELTQDTTAPALEWLVQFVLRTIRSWEIYVNPDDTEPYPVTEESVRQLPPEFLNDVLEAVRDHFNPPEPAQSFGSF